MITFFETVFALGTLWFWLLLLVDFVIITALVEHEEGIWATVVAILTVVGLNYAWKLPIISSIKTNPGHTALLVFAYFALGAGWSLVKWLVFLHKKNFAYEDVKADFLKKNNALTLTPELAAKLMDYLDELNRFKVVEDCVTATPPEAHDYKAMLTRWATYWPFSIIGTLLNDVVRRSWTYIIRLLQSTYQRMANYVFRKAADDIAMAEQYKAQRAVDQEKGQRVVDSGNRKR